MSLSIRIVINPTSVFHRTLANVMLIGGDSGDGMVTLVLRCLAACEPAMRKEIISG